MQITKKAASGGTASATRSTIVSTLTVTADGSGNLAAYAYSNEDGTGKFEFSEGADDDMLQVRLSAPGGCYLYGCSSSPVSPTQISPALTSGCFPAGTMNATLTFSFHQTSDDLTYVSFSVINSATGQILQCDPQVGNDPEPG